MFITTDLISRLSELVLQRLLEQGLLLLSLRMLLLVVCGLTEGIGEGARWKQARSFVHSALHQGLQRLHQGSRSVYGQPSLEVLLALELEGDGIHGHILIHVVFQVREHLVQTQLILLLAERTRKR